MTSGTLSELKWPGAGVLDNRKKCLGKSHYYYYAKQTADNKSIDNNYHINKLSLSVTYEYVS